MMTFNKNLKNELTYQDVCIKEFAHNLGIPYSTFLNYINSTGALPNVVKGYEISKSLNVSVEYLVTGKINDIKIKDSLYQTIILLMQLPDEQIDLIKKQVRLFYKLNN